MSEPKPPANEAQPQTGSLTRQLDALFRKGALMGRQLSVDSQPHTVASLSFVLLGDMHNGRNYITTEQKVPRYMDRAEQGEVVFKAGKFRFSETESELKIEKVAKKLGAATMHEARWRGDDYCPSTPEEIATLDGRYYTFTRRGDQIQIAHMPAEMYLFAQQNQESISRSFTALLATMLDATVEIS